MILKVKSKKICGVYKITNPKGECYIGQSIDVLKRFKNHKKNICSNKHLSFSLKKYGILNHKFEILQECHPANLYDREKYYISLYKNEYVLFNLTIRMEEPSEKIWGTGRKKYTIMRHPFRIIEVRSYIKKLKPKK